MIQGQYAVIRSADVDDAPALHALYDPAQPRAALLDPQRELFLIGEDDARELLAAKPAQMAPINAVEDSEGNVRGFCGFRGVDQEALYASWMLLYLDAADYEAPMTKEVVEYFLSDGFRRLHLRKIMAQCLDWEGAYRDALIRHGFESNGVQREVLYSQGRWHDMETFDYLAPSGVAQSA